MSKPFSNIFTRCFDCHKGGAQHLYVLIVYELFPFLTKRQCRTLFIEFIKLGEYLTIKGQFERKGKLVSCYICILYQSSEQSYRNM